MVLPTPKRPRRTEDNILPLINIVFLLLIFFMLAGALHTRPPFTLTPPETAHADDSELEPDLLSIAADGRMALGSVAISRDELSVRLEGWNPGLPLQIKADAALPARELTQLLTDLRAAGVAEVRLLTLHNP